MESRATDESRDWRELWTLDPDVTFLNHGSFGACPRAVLDLQSKLRARMESEPVRFMVRELEPMLDASRATLAEFVGARADDVAFVTNATAGVNTVLHSLRFEPGDELLVTNHEYNACRNVLDSTAESWGARVVVVAVPYPLESPDQVTRAIVAAVTERTRFALVDHVTSQTGLVLPVAAIAAEMRARGIDLLIDGAHAPGMVPLDIASLGVTYYTGNCHKWICAPKGAAFLWVHPERQEQIRPLAISHGWNSARSDRSRFRLLFDWTGTWDPTPYVCVGEAIRYMGSLLGGWDQLRARNRALVLAGRAVLIESLGVPAPAPEEMIGSLATVPLPPGQPREREPRCVEDEVDPLQDALWTRHKIEVPIVNWPRAHDRLVRISAQLYNRREQYETLASALVQELARR